jgi:hypothetical protein
LLGHGTARHHPRDPNVAGLARRSRSRRPCLDLTRLLVDFAAAELEDITHKRARLHL